MYSAELNVPQNHVYLFKPHTRRSRFVSDEIAMKLMEEMVEYERIDRDSDL